MCDRFTPPVAIVSSGAQKSSESVGLVLTGGGSFGAWEVGALQAFFDSWRAKYGEDPPIRVVAGTSTGALIAPFALLGRDEVAEAGKWYTSVNQSDITAPKLGAILPFPLFAITTASIYGTGYGGHSGLYGKLADALPDEKLARLTAMWPDKRLGAATLDFADGQPDIFTNDPARSAELRDGIFTSAMAPLAYPPIPLARKPGGPKTPHLDGGVYSVAPFSAFFDLAAVEPKIPVTVIVVISAFPIFPGEETSPVQKDPFPNNPKFRAVGDRMNVLLSEAGATADIRLAQAALDLRRAGRSMDDVQHETGLVIGEPIPELLILAPKTRLGWHALDFSSCDMNEMYRRGYQEGTEQLESDHSVALTTPPEK